MLQVFTTHYGSRGTVVKLAASHSDAAVAKYVIERRGAVVLVKTATHDRGRPCMASRVFPGSMEQAVTSCERECERILDRGVADAAA